MLTYPVFFGYWLLVLYFLGLLNKCCVSKCPIFSTVFSEVQFYSSGTSVSTVLHYYHMMLHFCQMNHGVGGYFVGFCFSESFSFLVFCQWKVFFWVIQKYPAPLIPVCRFAKSTPWDRRTVRKNNFHPATIG